MGKIGGKQLGAVDRVELVLVITEFKGNAHTAFILDNLMDLFRTEGT